MKKLLLSIVCLAAVTCQAQLLTSGPLVGTYLGIAIPAGKSCSTERLFVTVHVDADYSLWGDVVNWDNDYLLNFTAVWPFFDKRKFVSTVTPDLQIGIKASISPTSGTMSGVVDLRPGGGCRYTFKAYRRFKNN